MDTRGRSRINIVVSSKDHNFMLKRRNIEKPLLYQLNKNSFQSGIALSKVTALASLRTDGVIIEVVRPAEKMPSHGDLKT